MKSIILSMDQQIASVNEYWDVNKPAPARSSGITSEMIYKWVADRYNCSMIFHGAYEIEFQFEHDRDLTFFLLKFPQ